MTVKSGPADQGLVAEFGHVAEAIATRPELAFDEYYACETLSAWVGEHGFNVTSVEGYETAFVATKGSGGPNIGVLLEYDALPEVGHGCGHHLIGAGGALAGILAAEAIPEGAGTVTIVGCPAEESGAGKAHLVAAGVFDDLTTAMMFHPASTTALARASVAATNVTVTFHGVASHTARAPEHGRNALSALLFTFNGVDALRQRLGRWASISGIITDGGTAVNVVPSYTRASFLLRDVSRDAVAALVHELEQIALGAAMMTGTTARVTADEHVYAERRNNRAMLRALASEMREQGLAIDQPRTDESLGSSDIGNVSLHVPTIHPTLNVVVSEPVASHSHAFAQATRTPLAMQRTVQMATALAALATRIAADEALLSDITDEFHEGGFDAPGTDFTDLFEASTNASVERTP